jgi:preprotein translocase subunit SecE
MPKRDKEARKRALRRERAKGREDTGEFTSEFADGAGESDEGRAPLQAAATPRRAEKPVEEEPPKSFTEQTSDFFGPMTDFLKEVNIERKKINWPSREDSWRSTWVVVMTILFLAAFMGAFSFVFSRIAGQIFNVQAISAPAAPTETTPTLPIGGGLPTPPETGGGGTAGGGTQPPAGN